MAVTAGNNATTVVVSKDGVKGLPGTDGTDGSGFNQVRKSKLANPLLHLFKKNSISSVVAGNLTVTRSTTATYIDRYGVVQTAAIDTAREEAEGWLIEGASTNLLTYSEQFDNAAWIKSNCSVTADASTAPDGNTTADKVFAASGFSGFIRQDVTVNSGSDYTLSIFVEAAGKTNISLFMSDAGFGSNQVFDFDLSAVTASAGGSIEEISTGIFRCQATATATATASTQFRLYPLDNSDTGNGSDGVYFWGAQLEEQEAKASSYIPTTTTSVTRTADTHSVATSGNIPDPAGDWSIFCKVRMLRQFQPRQYISDIDVTTALRHSLIEDGGTISYKFGGATTTTVDLTSINVDEDYYIVVTHDSSTNTLTIDKNGGSETDSAVVTDYPALNLSGNSYIGRRAATLTENANINIVDYRVYDFALNTDEIKYLSGV